MTSERIYERLRAYVAACDETQRAIIDKAVAHNTKSGVDIGPYILADLLIDLSADIRDATNKAAGNDKNRLYTLAKALVKSAKALRLSGVAGAIIQGDEAIFTDGYHLLKTKDAFGIPEAPDLGDFTFESFNSILTRARSNRKELPLPDAGTLKAFIADRKVAGKRSSLAVYDFGRGLPAFTAEYLLDFARAMPGAVMLWEALVGAAYIKDPGSDAEGILLPIRKKDGF